MTERMDNKCHCSSGDALFEELYRQCETADKLSDEICSKVKKLRKVKRRRLVSRKKNGVTPLFISAKRGNLAIVKYLLVKCRADVNQFCKYSEVRKDLLKMTALMETQNVDVARCLLDHGAKYISTALLEHIFRSRFEVANYLVSRGADVNKLPTEKGKTCLDYAEDDPRKYELLLKYMANANVQNYLQDTPLHTAVKEDKLWKIEQLLKYGANPKFKNLNGDDVLRLSCRRGHEDIFSYLMDNVGYSDATRANAHELMGALYFINKVGHSNFKTIEHWKTALRIRHNNRGQFLERDPIEEPLIKNVDEFRTEDDLDWIVNRPRAIITQVLQIINRNFGHKDEISFKALYDVFNIYNVLSEYKQAIHVTMRVIYLLLRCTGDVQIHIRQIAVNATLVILNIVDKDGIEHVDVHFNDILTIVDILWAPSVDPMVIALLNLLVKMPKSDTQLKLLKSFVAKMVQKKYSDHNGRSLLHVVVSIKGILCFTCMGRIIYFPKSRNWDFMRLPVVQLLLECGHDVDALDHFGSSPLLLAASNKCGVDVVNCLLEHGAHIDLINAEGIRPFYLMGAVPGFNRFNHVTLKCLAARTIADHKVPYKHLKFPALDAFIEMH